MMLKPLQGLPWISLMLWSCFRERPWRSKTRGKTMVKPASFVLVCLQAGWWWDTHRVARIAMFLA